MLHHHNSLNHNKSKWILLIGIAVITVLLSGCVAQAAPRVYRVGILSGLDFVADITDGFKVKMAELGYVEGQNITYDVQTTNFDRATYKKILQKFVDDKVDLILVFPTEASLEAKLATQGTDIPVVFTHTLIDGTDLVKSEHEPGGNMTGVRFPGPDIAIKRFNIMRELAPQAKRMWVPYQKDYPTVNPQLEILRPAAAAAGVILLEAPANNAAELEADLQARVKGDDPGLDAILLLAEPLAVTSDSFAVMGKFAHEHELPIGGSLVSAGGYASIFGVNVNTVETGKQAACLADKILKGTPAGAIPVVSSDSYLQINYDAAP
ncbi:MAG: ABC transporter substrate-binding protein [Anaerolineales bacterium]|nr:ABC transporter substrate-binding protein [Anaerolineales bacterium]